MNSHGESFSASNGRIGKLLVTFSNGSIVDPEQLEFLGPDGVKILCSVLNENKTWKTVALWDNRLSPQEWTEILRSLRGNDTVENLDLSDCQGLTSSVFEEIKSLLYTNGRLQSIALSGTELESKVDIVDKELRVNEEYRTNRAPEPMITRRAGCIVLCGRPFAGKTFIRKTWQRLQSHAREREKHRQRHPYLAPAFPGFHRGVVKRILPGKRDLGKGPEILLIENTFVWDFPGKREFYVVHDRMFPNAGNLCFLYVCSATHPGGIVKTKEDIGNEFEHWLCSKASKSNHIEDQNGQSQRLCVTFVMTHVGPRTLDSRERRQSENIATDIVKRFRAHDEFRTLLDISDTVKFIDARSPKDAESVLDELQDHLATILPKLTEYEVYAMVRDRIQSEHPSKPILTWQQVKDTCAQGDLLRRLRYRGSRARGPTAQESNEVAFEEGLKIALKYLNDVGDVVYMEGLKFVIVQVDWFAHTVLDYLVDPFQGNGVGATVETNTGTSSKQTVIVHHDKGFVPKERVIESLKRLLGQDIFNEGFIDLMIRWEICFNEVPENEGTSSNTDPRLFFPTLLGNCDGDRDLRVRSEAFRWTLHAQGPTFVGRRFVCEKLSMYLRPGFFPRLQVMLRIYLRGQDWLDNCHFAIGPDIIRFACGGMQVIVEYSVDIDYFVDVLVNSTESFEQTVGFISHHVETKIVELCTSEHGCPGVNLVTSVVRPECVKRLLLCKERKDASVPIQTLLNIKESEKDTYMWKSPIPGIRCRDWDTVGHLLYGQSTANPSKTSGDLTTSKHPEGLPARYSVTSTDVSVIRRIEGSLHTARVIPVKIHVFCDGTEVEGSHPIDDQLGRDVFLAETSEDLNLSILKLTKDVLYEAAQIAAGVFNVRSTKHMDKLADTVFTTPNLDVSVLQLQKIAHISGKVPTAEILKILEKYLHACPNIEWLKRFLNLKDMPAFQRHFKLEKVTNSNGKDLFLCAEHAIEVKQLLYNEYQWSSS